MNLKFIGTDGSMGLKHGEVYDILIDPNYKFDGIIIKWIGADANLHTCPYSSPAAFAANWAKPEPALKVTVRKKKAVKDGSWRVGYKKTVEPVKGVKNETD